MHRDLLINWPYLLLALALLGMPRQWLRNGGHVFKRRRRKLDAIEKLKSNRAHNSDDLSVRPGKEFASFRNYIDFFRALAGSYCLGFVALAWQGEGPAFPLLGLEAGILLVAISIQVLRTEGKGCTFFAPIFYFVGLCTGFPGHFTGLFAFALMLAINPAIGTPRLFLTVYGLLLVVVGYVFEAPRYPLLLSAMLMLLVPLGSLLARRPVVIFSRKPRRVEAS